VIDDIARKYETQRTQPGDHQEDPIMARTSNPRDPNQYFNKIKEDPISKAEDDPFKVF